MLTGLSLLAADKVLTSGGKPVVIDGKTVVVSDAWTPADGTTFAWWTSTDTSTITESVGFVSGWSDKLGNQADLKQILGAYQPTYGATNLNGYAVISFDGIDDKLTNTTSFPTDSDFMVVVTVRVATNAVSSGDGIISTDDGVAPSFKMVGGLAPNFFAKLEGSTNANVTGNLDYRGSWKMFGIRYNRTGGKWARWVDGELSNEAVCGGTQLTLKTLILGSSLLTIREVKCDIADVVFTDGTDTNEFNKIFGYEAWTYGIQGNLPVGHPYKSTRPLK